MKKMTLFFFVCFSMILGEKIKKGKKSRKNKCKNLLYSFLKQNSCIQEHCNISVKFNKIKSIENKIFLTCKKELIQWYEKLTKKN